MKTAKTGKTTSFRTCIVGCGGMGIEAYGILLQNGFVADVFCEQNARKVSIFGLPVIDIEEILPSDRLIFAIGSPKRKNLVKSLFANFHLSLIHRSALVGKSSVGIGSIICANTVITESVNIGKYCIINLGCTVSHHSEIGDFTTLCPQCCIGGNVKIGRGCFVGIGTCVSSKLEIGNGVFIGAGSVVVKDIPSNVLVYGNPARVVRKITEEELYNLI